MTRTTLNVKLRGNCYFWLFMHLLSLRPPSLRVDDRLLETEKSVGTKFCTIFLASRPAANFLLRVYYWCSYCLLVRWKNTLWGQKDMYLKARNKTIKSRNSSRWWRQLMTKGWCWWCAFAILWVPWECQKVWWLWRMEVFLLRFGNLIWNLGHSWICNLINEKMSVIYVDIHS